MNYYIRIGELPRDGKSKIYQWEDKTHSSRAAIGEEAGVSVYEAKEVEKGWNGVIPENIKYNSTMDTINYLMKEAIRGDKPVYVVIGDEVGKGYDGEPVITNVKIIKDISNNLKEIKVNNEIEFRTF